MVGLPIAMGKDFLTWLGKYSNVKSSVKPYIINNDSVEQLKEALENENIDTDVAGLTPMRLRKILMAYVVTSSLSNTLCAVEVTDKDIISDFEEKHPGELKNIPNEQYNNLTMQYLIGSNNEGKCYFDNSKTSHEVWTQNEHNYPNYTLYYDNKYDNYKSDLFFYFKDTEGWLNSEKKGAWYFGAMGATTITNEKGQEFGYVTPEEFEKLKEEFEAFKGKKVEEEDYANKTTDKRFSESFEKMLVSYTDGEESNTIKIYNVNSSLDKYYYNFKYGDGTNSKLQIQQPKQTGNSIMYNVNDITECEAVPETINLDEQINLSQYSISIELMLNLLSMTASGEFLETFIDYAVNQISATATAYSLTTETVSYDIRKYNIKNDFVFELYDVIDSGISGYQFDLNSERRR